MLLNALRAGFIAGSCKRFDTILDVGYGNGLFLSTVESLFRFRYGYDVTDIPVPESATKVDSIADRHYDVITFFDSLEHIKNLDFVENLSCKYIVVSVPYCHWKSDKDDIWFRDHYKHRRENEHYWHFSPESLQIFMFTRGYRTIVGNAQIEDIVRTPYDDRQNIITACFKKIIP